MKTANLSKTSWALGCNGFWTHCENVPVAMLADEQKGKKAMAVDQIRLAGREGKTKTPKKYGRSLSLISTSTPRSARR